MTLRKTLRVIIPTIALTGIYLFNGYDTESSRSRNLSVALRDGGCFVLPAQEPGAEVQPVFAASYPGSGARMTWNLIGKHGNQFYNCFSLSPPVWSYMNKLWFGNFLHDRTLKKIHEQKPLQVLSLEMNGTRTVV